MAADQQLERGMDRLARFGLYDALAAGFSFGTLRRAEHDLLRAAFAESYPAQRDGERRAPRRILIVGGGSGAILIDLLRIANASGPARIDYAELSGAMLRRARRRLAKHWKTNAFARHSSTDLRFLRTNLVDFLQTSAHRRRTYDWIIVPYVLDFFAQSQATQVLKLSRDLLAPEGRILLADFARPERSAGSGGRLRRAVFRAILKLLYACFRWSAGLQTRDLPDLDAAARAAGLHSLRSKAFWGGLIETQLLAPR